MKTVQDIYDSYRIMPNLQLHQLRVAAVASFICDHFTGPVDRESVVFACLFHDMGNIIKSDFKKFPEFLQPLGLAYWQGVKDEYIAAYGADEHVATLEIVRTFLPQKAVDCVQRIGFRNAKANDADNVFEYKIANYSDMRVAPHGVVSMEDRVEEGRRRYSDKNHPISTIVGNEFNEYVAALARIEKDIFARTDIKPADITDVAVHDRISSLRMLEIQNNHDRSRSGWR